MYKPDKTYKKMSISENHAEHNFSVWFEEEPELLVRNILRAMGFKVKDHGREFYHVTSKFKLDFAEQLKEALEQGEFPTTIPYIPSYYKDSLTIDAGKYSIVYILPDKTDDTLKDQLVIFETTEDKRDGFGYLATWVKHGSNNKDFSIIVTPRAGRLEAKALLKKKDNVAVSLPNPFGTFGEKISLEGLDATSNLDHIYQSGNTAKENRFTKSSREAAINSWQDLDNKIIVGRLDQIDWNKESSQTISQDRTLTDELAKENWQDRILTNNLASEKKFASTDNQDVTTFSQDFSQTISQANSQDRTRKIELAEENSQERTLTNELAKENSQEGNLTSETEQQTEINLSKRSFEQLLILLPNLKDELERGVKSATSLEIHSANYLEVEFYCIEHRSNAIYLLQLNFIDIDKVKLSPPLKVQFIIDFENELVTIENWLNDDENLFDRSKISKFIEIFYHLLRSVIRDGHLFSLDQEEPEIEETKEKELLVKKALEQAEEKITVVPRSRIDLNRSIEALIDQKGFDSVDYSPEEIELISQYSGYGGSKLSETNKGLLYEYYTPEEIVKMMWIQAYELGYNGGAVLEPSCGTGNYIKYAPRNARIEGYETNKYSARICQLLYPHATIHNKSFENLFFNGNIYLNGNFRTEPFDLIIGNPPYGQFTGKYAGLGEKKRTKSRNYEHYFINRGLDLLKPDGLLVYVIPNSFIINGDAYNALKGELALKCTIEHGFRLTKEVFKHTSIETDILVLRRRKKA